MLIRHKITIWFIGLCGILLFLFSAYIYLASENSRRQLFYERLKNKALATKEIYDQHDLVAERIITSIPEQSEYVFDENNKLIFAINDLHDFVFDESFFKSMTTRKDFYFEYGGGVRVGHKEGYAFSFETGLKKRIIVITAYNKTSFDQLLSLRSILLLGNLFFLAVIGIAAYVISTTAFRPINDLVKEVESVQGHNLSFRLKNSNQTNEIGIVASSFNKVLDRMQTLMESQKAFISYASHELRTPLAAINGILETSLKYDQDFEASIKSKDAAKKEIVRAITLVNGLLALAKIESIRNMERTQKINIVDVLLDAISYYKLKNPIQEFLLELGESFSRSTVEIDGDIDLLRMAFTNLIDNASKYSQKRKIKIVLVFRDDKKISISIIDSGIGIESQDRAHVFEPLFRGKNTGGIEGFGLGLSLAQRIIKLHEGELHFRANEPTGAIVEVLIATNSNALPGISKS